MNWGNCCLGIYWPPDTKKPFIWAQDKFTCIFGYEIEFGHLSFLNGYEIIFFAWIQDTKFVFFTNGTQWDLFVDSNYWEPLVGAWPIRAGQTAGTLWVEQLHQSIQHEIYIGCQGVRKIDEWFSPNCSLYLIMPKKNSILSPLTKMKITKVVTWFINYS